MLRIILIAFTLFLNSSCYAAEVIVAVRAHSGIDQAGKQWQATIDALSARIPGHHFSLLPIINLDEITTAAGQGRFDFIITNPSSYVELHKKYQANALATLNNRRANTAQSRFGSVIFTHVRNTDLVSLKDLKGRSLMAVSEPAFGGWRVAWLEMLEQGIDPYTDFSVLLFAPGHTQNEVVYAVRDGAVDAGVVRTDQLERMSTAGQVDLRYFRILNNRDTPDFPFFHSTPLYPEWPFASMPAVDPALQEQVREALLGIAADSEAATRGDYVGWVEALDYSVVDTLMQRLAVGPYAGPRPVVQKPVHMLNSMLLWVVIVVIVLIIVGWRLDWGRMRKGR